MYAKVTYTDGTFDQIEKTFNVGINPDLHMDYLDNGNFQLRLIPEEFFNVPATLTIDYLSFISMKTLFATGADRVSQAVNVQIECQ